MALGAATVVYGICLRMLTWYPLASWGWLGMIAVFGGPPLAAGLAVALVGWSAEWRTRAVVGMTLLAVVGSWAATLVLLIVALRALANAG